MQSIVVLCVDDLKVGNDARTKILRGAGFNVVQAYSGSQAIKCLQTEPRIDVVLLDYYLGDCTGEDVLPHIRSLHPNAKVAVISGSVEREHLSGFDCILTKPLDPPQLIRSIVLLMNNAA